MSDNRTFEASFRCESRADITSQTLPYRIAIGTQAPAYLQPQIPSLGALLGT